jgi:hypothetical protein
LELTRDASVTSTGPEILRWTLKATPGANDGPAEYWLVPLLLHSTIKLDNAAEFHCDVRSERDFLKGLRQSRRVVTAQEDVTAAQVQVENFEWAPDGLNYGIAGYGVPDGTMTLQLKVIS